MDAAERGELTQRVCRFFARKIWCMVYGGDYRGRTFRRVGLGGMGVVQNEFMVNLW